MRARRVSAVDGIHRPDGLADYDYADAFQVTSARPVAEPAEACMRSILEGAPWLLRWFVLAGWTTVLLFRPGPRRSPAHILGWPIVQTTPDLVVLERHSRLMAAQLALHVGEPGILWTTLVRYEHRAARAVWVVVGLLHRSIVRYVLGRAARLLEQSAAG